MIHIASLTIPPSTPLDAPVTSVVKLTACVIKRVRIEFPLGCYWLAGVRVLYNTFQLYPTTPDEWFTGHGSVIEFTDNTVITDVPYELELQGVNADAYYEHTVRFAFDVEELTLLRPGQQLSQVTYGYVV